MKKSNELSLGDAIQQFLKAHDLSDKYTETEIYSRWDELAGKAINLKTRKVVYKEGKLTVFLTSSVLRNELSLRKADFLIKINQRFRQNPIRDIVFR